MEERWKKKMMYQKYERLKTILSSYESLIVAFSGGVDSSFLLKVAHDILGKKVLALSVQTPYIAQWEMDDASAIADEIGATHLVVKKPWIEALRLNPENRCYLCKHDLFFSIKKFANERGFNVVAEGSNVDDTMEHRPGRVALDELSIATPLLEAGLTKAEIRALSKEFGLSTWDKASYACLLTRFSYNHWIKESALAMVDAAEGYMIEEGYGTIRVRYEQGIARIEMPKSLALELLNDNRLSQICAHLKELGFLHVTLDLEGYRYQNDPIKGM